MFAKCDAHAVTAKACSMGPYALCTAFVTRWLSNAIRNRPLCVTKLTTDCAGLARWPKVNG
jgi:hypothetical protein